MLLFLFSTKAITTSKWDYFEDYQSDKSENDNSQDSIPNQQQSKDNSNSKSSSNENMPNDQQDQQNYQESAALYKQYNDQKKELNEEKRQMLRDIEVKAVKFMDDLESGRVESKQNMSIQQQVDIYRHTLFRDVSKLFFKSNEN